MLEMKGPAIVMTLVLLIAGVTAIPLSGLAQSGDVVDSTVEALQTPGIAENETAEAPPGARLAAVVGAQQAEVRGEVDSRAFDAALERAGSDRGKARAVARQAERLEERLADLEERKEELRRAYQNGNISTATYVAELTELTARSESTRGLANQSHAAARDLPDDVARREGVNVTAIGALERRAANLTGPEVAQVARTMAGPDVGRPVGAGPPDHAGPANNRSTGPPGEESTGPPDERGNGSAADSARPADGAANSSNVVNGTDRIDVGDASAGNASENAGDAVEATPAGGDGSSGAGDDASDVANDSARDSGAESTTEPADSLLDEAIDEA